MLFRTLFVSALALAPRSALAGPADAASAPTPDADAEPARAEQGRVARRVSRDPSEITGLARPAEEPSDFAREAADRVLWVPRAFAELVFVTTGAAAGLYENEQVVPRAKELFFSRGGAFGVFPTLFIETGSTSSVGARMVAYGDGAATTLRVGYGGEDENVVESRMRFVSDASLPFVVSVEGLHDRRTGMGFLGVGQSPATDSRNHFRGAPTSGVLRERRERAIVGLGARPATDVEVLASASYTQRLVDDPHDAGASALTRVFEPESIAGALRETRVVYAETALRYDSRESRSGIAAGEIVEAYVGEGVGVGDDDVRYLAVGGRAGVYRPVHRLTNMLSPRIVLDAVAHQAGEEIPFRELPSQPSFRGFNSRRDAVSIVASLDYRWRLMRFVAARVFVDAAAVGKDAFAAATVAPRWAVGFGVDLHTSTSELGRVGVAASPEGVLFLLSLGVAAGFGDRQHRD